MRGEVSCASCCQLNGEWNTIQTSTNSRDGRRVGRCQLKIRHNCLRSLHEERDRSIMREIIQIGEMLRRWKWQWENLEQLLGLQVEHYPAGNQHLQLRAACH